MHFSLDLIKIIVMKYLEEWNLNIGKPRKLGKTIEEIEEGDSLSLTESIEDQQLLLYLGLTNDANPLFIQHDYA